MKKRSLLICIVLLFIFLPAAISFAQENDYKPLKNKKEEKNADQNRVFNNVDSLVNSRQFVFKADYGPHSDEIFVVVDSAFAEIQYGNRNNLVGRVTRFEITKNEKRKTLAVTILLRAEINSADVFIFIGSSGNGKATIKSDFPGYFTFDGQIVDFENADIYEGGSHLAH